MTQEPLATYLHDHLAGATFAIDLIEFVQGEHAGQPLGQFASVILLEVRSDRDTLRQISERIGGGRESVLKEAASWLGERAARWKLNRRAAGDFAAFEALDLLAVGILGKRGLWRALKTIAPTEDRLEGIDFDQLMARAQSQHDRVEQYRLRIATDALAPPM